MTTHSDLKARFKEAKRELEQRGWQQVLSQASDCAPGQNYGVLFMRDEESFWLNVETIDRLAD